MLAAPLALIFLQLLANPTQQEQQTPKATIEGIVVRVGTNEPIPRAQVTLTRTVPVGGAVLSGTAGRPTPVPSNAGGLRPVTSDSRGRFIFKDVEAGSYRLSAGRNGYVRQEYGQRAPLGRPGTVLNLVAGQTMKDVVIRLTPAGNVSGRITDSTGEPLPGIPVQLMRYAYNPAGQRTFQMAGTDRTDDHGEYRIYWVTPGRYSLSAGSLTGQQGLVGGGPNAVATETYVTTYYPGITDPSKASIIDIEPGAELSGMDFFLVPQQAYQVRGRVIDARTGRQPDDAGVSIIPRQPAGPILISISSSLNYNRATGMFEFRGVVPGQYWVRVTGGDATLGAPLTPGTVAQIPVDVSGSNVENLVVTLTPGVSVPGRLSVENQALPTLTGLDPITVSLRPSAEGQPLMTPLTTPPTSQPLKSEGTFRIDNVHSGEYLVTVGPLPPDFYVKEARMAGTDVLQKGMLISGDVYGALEIVLSPNAGQIDGTVADDNQQPLANSQVVLVPNRFRERRDLYKTAVTGQNGHFTLRGILPGEYRLFAWEDIEPFAYFDLDLLTRFEPRGKPVSVSESSKIRVDVNAIPAMNAR